MIAGGLAHDLNNHLTMIAHTAELEQMLNEPARHEAAWKQIMQLSDQARETVRKIQAFGRKTSLSHRRVNLAALTTATIKLLRGACAPRVQLNLKLELPEAWLNGVENQLEAVLIHLVMMAVDSLAGVGGNVNVRLALKESKLSVSNADAAKSSGAGEVHWSVSTETVQKDVWRALLALMDTPDADILSNAGHFSVLLRKIIMAHGGNVQAIADREGAVRGLLISLPLLNPVIGKNTERKLGPTVFGPRLRGLKVALVEDEVTEGDLLRNALIQQGARVCAFNSAADFSRWLKGGEGPDVLITDWVLTDGAGDELVRQVRASDADVPVILMSGRLQENELADDVLSGRARFLGKPFMIEELIVLLAEWQKP
jgi:CheY-like chemotaxis protein